MNEKVGGVIAWRITSSCYGLYIRAYLWI